MTDHPHEISIRVEDFDLGLLEPHQRMLTGDSLSLAIQRYFENEFKAGIGAAQILVTPDQIVLRWRATDTPRPLVDQAVNFLSSGDYARGIALLEIVLRGEPDNQDALYNLGMALSDQGRLDESEARLRRLLELDPDFARAWVALGVALARKGDLRSAADALRSAVRLNPDDGFALRSLGTILIENEDTHEEAELLLSRAAEILPEDPLAWVNLGKLREKAGDLDRADDAYCRVLEINPHSQVADKAKEGRSRIVEQRFRKAGIQGSRPDAMMYCLGALERFEGMPLTEVQKITFEIATLGMSGINVNDPEEKYTLRSIPGKFSGLHLLCIEYVGFKRLDPSVDIGFDISQEYQEALALHAAK